MHTSQSGEDILCFETIKYADNTDIPFTAKTENVNHLCLVWNLAQKTTGSLNFVF